METRTLSQQTLVINFMNKVYLWMTLGIAITAITAYITSQHMPEWQETTLMA